VAGCNQKPVIKYAFEGKLQGVKHALQRWLIRWRDVVGLGNDLTEGGIEKVNVEACWQGIHADSMRCGHHWLCIVIPLLAFLPDITPSANLCGIGDHFDSVWVHIFEPTQRVIVQLPVRNQRALGRLLTPVPQVGK
jgi:hypothetical protein